MNIKVNIYSGYILICLLVIMFLPVLNSRASGIMGSDLTWECVGRDSFLVKVAIYEDCNDIKMDGSSNVLNVVCKSSGKLIISDTLKMPTPEDITPTWGSDCYCTRCQSSSCPFPYGIEKYKYTRLVILSNAGNCCEITLSFVKSKRNSAITTGAAGEIFYIEAMMNRCVSPCVSSPQFTNDPVAITFTGQDFYFYNDAKMPVGSTNDSVVFSWTPPLKWAGNPTDWLSPFDYTKPLYFVGFPNSNLPAPQGFHLNPQTGDFQFRPVKSDQTVMALKVSQFRKGVKIGETRRDFQVIVINIPRHIPALEPAVYYKEVCAGSPVTFTINTNDTDLYDTVTISWNKAIPGALWTDNNGKVQHPTGTFTWTPGDGDASNVPYTFTVTARDNPCFGIYSSNTHAYQVLVKPIPYAVIYVTDSGSGLYSFYARPTKGNAPAFLWQGANFTFSPNTGAITSHQFTSTGIYPWTMKMTAQMCERTFTDTLKILTLTIDGNEPVNTYTVVIPNPVKGVSILKTGYAGSKNSMVIFYNSSGKEIRRGYLINSEFEIRQKDFGKGVFFYKIMNGDKMIDNGELLIE